MRFPAMVTLLVVLPLHAQVKLTQQTGTVMVAIDGKPYSTFFLAPDGNKPYLYPLSTASGAVVTRHLPPEDFPGEATDHPHQRGLFFSHGDINGWNFWAPELGDTKKPGRMTLKGAPEIKGASIVAVFEGRTAGGRPMMTETRTITFYPDSGLRTIDYEVRIDAIDRLSFADTKEGTFGIRLATSMSEDHGGRMTNAQGRAGEKDVWGKRADWVDYCGPVGGQTVGVAILDHPANPRHPTYWHSRAYGLFAANPFGSRSFAGNGGPDGTFTLQPGQSTRFRYRVVIHDGDTKAAGIAALYRQYAAK